MEIDCFSREWKESDTEEGGKCEMKVVEYAKGIRIFADKLSVYFVSLNYIP